LLHTSKIFYINNDTHKYPNLTISLLFTSVTGRDSLHIQRATVNVMSTQPWTVYSGYPPACGGTRQGTNNPSGCYYMLHRT